jgi:DNA-binding response OmpR family regulator
MEKEFTKKILIVEDEEPLRKALEQIFTQESFHVVSAKDGDEGFRVAVQEQPDILLLDILMPQMDGMTMLKKLRKESTWGARVPVVFLTNVSPFHEHQLKDIRETEPVCYCVKTHTPLKDIVEKVRIQLERPR